MASLWLLVTPWGWLEGEWGNEVHAPTFVTMDLPFEQDVLWYQEFNIVAVSPRLTEQERECAIDRLQAEWRRALHPMVRAA